MARIVLEKTLNAPVEHVFDLISAHAAYAENFRGITHSELVREGNVEPNGLGAVRRIASGPLRFEEEITAFERPVRMDYLILTVNAPIEHEGGSIRLEPAGETTRVVWTSTFTATTPWIGGAAGTVTAALFKRGFASMLDRVEELYPAEPVPA
jgi:uncharacterized protein YndB with AHSA1/START domain